VTEKFAVLTRIRRYSFTSNLEYSLDPIQETLALLEKQNNREPKNALFTIKDGKVSAFSQEKDGLAINSENAIAQVRSILTSEAVRMMSHQVEPSHIAVTSSILKPEVSLSDANTLGIEEVIGVGTSDYSGSIPERVHNLLLASQKLHGTLIPKGLFQLSLLLPFCRYRSLQGNS
jgi:vancomycin resistance protein YoaR